MVLINLLKTRQGLFSSSETGSNNLASKTVAYIDK